MIRILLKWLRIVRPRLHLIGLQVMPLGPSGPGEGFVTSRVLLPLHFVALGPATSFLVEIKLQSHSGNIL
jgi:hypothetical protein